MFFNSEHTRTSFIQLDTKKCKACWKCIEICPNQVIGKVDIPWHKHAKIVKHDDCTGCLNCIDICQYGAYSINDGTTQKTEKKRKHILNNFLINNLLFVFGLMMIFSGLTLQIGFHMGGPNRHQNGAHNVQFQSMQYEKLRATDANKTVFNFNYSAWSAIHKFVIVFFSLLMIYHTYVHWKWYKGVIAKHLIGKNRQLIILSVIFLLVAVTGLIPWFIDLLGGKGLIRMFFIEIHDKIALILIVFLVLHIVKRIKWFATIYAKLKGFG
jgi:NAD-dependent dihydropyrimidine dehydrogenase PreA subunit